MLFYKYTFESNEAVAGNMTRSDRCEAAEKIADAGEAFSDVLKGNAFIFVSDMKRSKYIIAGIFRADALSSAQPRDIATRFAAEVIGAGSVKSEEEITEKELLNLLRAADHRDYISDEDDIIEAFELDTDFRHSRNIGEEIILGEGCSPGEAKRRASRYCCGDTLTPELVRIYVPRQVHSLAGQPVLYTVSSTEAAHTKAICLFLLETLYKNARLCSRRTTVVDASGFDNDSLRSLYKRSMGGSIVFELHGDFSDDEYADVKSRNLRFISEMIKEYPLVLTVFCVSQESEKQRERITELLPYTVFVDIREDVMTEKKAWAYLEHLAKERGVRTTRGLFASVDKTTPFTVKNLNKAFLKWYGGYLRTDVFPAYKSLAEPRAQPSKPKGDAYKELNDMIGLASAKKTILSAVDYYKAQKLFKDEGAFSGRPSMHMVFSGSPGTAKTTAARLFARIMYDNGLLSTGDFVEVGRSELVGKYVGWTASIVKDKFKQAKGGVLFIDEAYSLVDDRKGMFGDEAINTIVQEMENMREDVVVIFAGYSEEMNEFLARNPGLKSRIAFHIDFPDYTADELLQIAKLIAKSKGRSLDESAKAALYTDFIATVQEDNFGNGRYVRNLIEQAAMRQATRLLKLERADVMHKDIFTLTAADFEFPSKAPKKRAIGF